MPGWKPEQVLRAEGFARLELATAVSPESRDASALWNAIERELSREGGPEPILSFDGLRCIAQELAGIAG